MCHRLLCKLRICLVRICNKCNTSSIENTYCAPVSYGLRDCVGKRLTPLDLPPFREVPCHDLFNILADVYPTNIDRSILPHKATNASHVISVVRMFVSPKDIDIRIKHVVNAWESM